MLDNIKENIEITNFSSFRTKAFTRYFYEINSEEDVFQLKELFDFFYEKKLDLTILWRWTNTLFAFDEYNWVIIKNNLRIKNIITILSKKFNYYNYFLFCIIKMLK